MKIDINQRKISVGDKYRIFTEGQESHKAATRLFKLLSVIDLYKSNEEKPVLTIEKQWFFTKPRYNIITANGRTSEFKAESWWKMYYQCYVGSDNYQVYGHRSRKFSVYRNGKQEAWWEKEAVSWFEGDNYSITANSDCHVEIIIAFCLILDNHKSKQHGNNAFSYNIRNIGGEVKPFDSYWNPR